jgi:2,5-diamino-6-(ribosylamino)-4(3H)-pyrimidinone 5'-phosphate reductase
MIATQRGKTAEASTFLRSFRISWISFSILAKSCWSKVWNRFTIPSQMQQYIPKTHLSIGLWYTDSMKTTLFMLMSFDGKISTGSSDERDFDKDLPNIVGAKEGLQQYYELEKKTDRFSFNTGRVMAKVGWNDEKANIEKLPVVFVVVDNKPHLTARGVENLIKRTEKLYIVTTNEFHPALKMSSDQLEVITYSETIDFANLFERLAQKGAKTMTIQSGGDMNAVLLREGLINELSIVVAPVLVGGKDTPGLIGGESLQSIEDLQKIKVLELLEANKLEHNYLHLRYSVS